MGFQTICFFLVCVGGCLSCQTHNSKIVGGRFTDLSKVPYTVRLHYSFIPSCGATIISQDWVVTAAHCVYYSDRKSGCEIMSGSNWRYFGTAHPVSKIIIHESYDSITGDYDIALIKVSKPFRIGKRRVKAAALPEEGSTPEEGTMARASGWGVFTWLMGIAIRSPYLRAVDVPIVNKEKCATLYKKNFGRTQITARMICAGHMKGGKDACQGDSGGPLVVKNVLVGIVSWGSGCAKPEFPGVYTNVGYFRKWIRDKTGI